MMVVAAVLKVTDEKGDEMEKLLREFVPKTSTEAGTIAYVAHRSIDEPSKFFVYEKYENEEAFKAHSSTPHFKEFAKEISSMLQGRPDIGRYREITA